MRVFAFSLSALLVSISLGELHAETTTIRVHRSPITISDFAPDPYRFTVVNSAGKQVQSCRWRMRWVVGGHPGYWFDLTDKTVCKLVFKYPGIMELQCRGSFTVPPADRLDEAGSIENFVCTKQFTIKDSSVDNVEIDDGRPSPSLPPLARPRSPGDLSPSAPAGPPRMPGTGTNTPYPRGSRVAVEFPTGRVDGILQEANTDGWIFILEAGSEEPTAVYLTTGVKVRIVRTRG